MKIRNLSLGYEDKEIFRDFSLDVEDYKTTAIMGNSGIGKTTLLNCIAGSIPYSGEISGVGVKSYMFQEPRLIDALDVYDNLLFAFDGKKTEENERAVFDMAKRLELQDDLASFIGELSGGMQCRVALGRAFLRKSQTILLDEPMHSLDIGLKFRLLESFKSLLKEDRRTAVYVTHDVDEALFVADRIVVLGGTPSTVVGDYAVDSENRDELRREILDKLVKM